MLFTQFLQITAVAGTGRVQEGADEKKRIGLFSLEKIRLFLRCKTVVLYKDGAV